MSDRTNTHDEPQGGDFTTDAAGKSSRTDCDGNSWWEDRSIAQKILLGIGIGILVAGAIFLFGLVTKLLWNWLMPEIFGLPRLTYWQAWGLLILSCILFKGLGSGESGGRRDRKRKRHLRRYMQKDWTPGGNASSESPGAPQTSSVD